MTPKIIVSYDDTANDRDALALGRLFAEAGASISLAYVRHAREPEHVSERLEEAEAEALLERGAESLGDPHVDRHVVVSASTPEGLVALALREDADVVVFASDYRTAPGHVLANKSAQRMLEGGPVAIAIAPASLRERVALEIRTIGIVSDETDPAVRATAEALAERLDATISDASLVDLLVVGSRHEAPEGRVLLSAACEYAVETAICPVLALPRGVALRFARTAATA